MRVAISYIIVFFNLFKLLARLDGLITENIVNKNRTYYNGCLSTVDDNFTTDKSRYLLNTCIIYYVYCVSTKKKEIIYVGTYLLHNHFYYSSTEH